MVVTALLSGATRVGSQALRMASRVGKGSKLSQKSIDRMSRVSQDDLYKQQAHRENMKEIDRLTSNIQMELIKNIQKQLEVDDINFTGGLSESVEQGLSEDFKTVDINSPYAKVVEFGMPPGVRVNFDALREWVEKKLGISNEDELVAVTIKIQNKIASKGIKPKRFVKKAIKALIAKRGVIRTSGNHRKIGKFEKKINKALKITRKISKLLRKMNKFKSKADKVRRGKF